MYVKDTNYYQVCGWMLRLGLTGYQLPVYAIIFGFSQDGKSWFSGSLNYLAEFANCTQRNIQKVLKQLEEKHMIEKRSYTDESYKRVFYKAIVPMELSSLAQNSVLGGMELSSMGYGTEFLNNGTEFHGGMELSSNNNKDIYISNNKEDNKECSKKPKRAPKKEYAPFVRLTEKEYTDFIGEYGNDVFQQMIDILNNYKESTGKKYKSDAAAIRSWVVDAYYERNNKVVNKPGKKIGVLEAQQELERRLSNDNESNESDSSSIDPVWGVWAE